jgi:putative transposase
MNQYNPQKHHRRSIRLKGYDYSQAGLYFITICCQERAQLFGEVIESEMNLNIFGQIAFEEWLQTEKIRENCKLHEFIIMPNHIHGIIEILFNKGDKSNAGKFKSPSHTIGSFIRGFKIAAIKKIKDRIQNSNHIHSSTGELQFAPTNPAPTEFTLAEKIKALDFKIWQRNYYEHIIRNYQSYQRISNYIINNPAKWEEDKFNKK